MNNRRNIFNTVDWTTIVIYFIMVVLGWFAVYSASFDYEHTDIFDFSLRHGKQIVWIALGLLTAFLILMVDEKIYDVFAYPVYAIMIVILIITIFIAPDVKGSHSWLVLGPISIQPAEFSKFITALALAKLISTYGFKMSSVRSLLMVGLIICLPMLIIVLQQETGSALVFAAFVFVLYREGLTGWVLFMGVSAIVYFVVSIIYADTYISNMLAFGMPEDWGKVIVFVLAFITQLIIIFYNRRDIETIKKLSIALIVTVLLTYLLNLIKSVNIPYSYALLLFTSLELLYCLGLTIYNRRKTYFLSVLFLVGSVIFSYSVNFMFTKVLQPHQQMRIKVTLGIEDDPDGAGYNVRQSEIAIGSGGFWGKGFLNGTQTKLKYVPEQETDFIYCTIGEEKGFVGSVFVLLLYLGLLFRLIFLAERQKSVFNRVYGYSVASIMFFHLVVNVGMVIGLTPVIGIPLPFFSYGGSSLWGFTILLFIFLKLDGTRSENI